MLIVLSGLSGTGKTTTARELARQVGAVHLRVDSIEQAIRESGAVQSMDDAGYRVAYAVAEDNLRIGRTVIADSVNPWPVTRDAWSAVAKRAGVAALEVEVVCSDEQEHRTRVETRTTDVPGLHLPTWQDVVDRDYRPWDRERLVLDTAGRTVEDGVRTLRTAIGRARTFSRPTRAIVITGSMGSGKTTVLGEASDLLAGRGIVHATIDVDGLANGHLPVAVPVASLSYRNLASICQNYVSAGVAMFLVAEAVESRADLERLRDALDSPEVVVCRLTAPLETMQQRVRVREPGVLQQRFVDRAAELEAILDVAALEDFAIVNADRSVTEVATDVLVRAGWV